MVLAIGLVIANKKEKAPKSIQGAVTQPIKISACNMKPSKNKPQRKKLVNNFVCYKVKIDNSSNLRHWEYNPLFFLSYLGFGLIGSDIWHISCSWYNISLQLGHSKKSKENKTNKTKKGLTKPQRESIFPPFSTFQRQPGTWNTFWCFPDAIKKCIQLLILKLYSGAPSRAKRAWDRAPCS